VFPSVGKGGIVVGGAYGKGLVIADNLVEGYTTLTQATVGLQLGGQKYAQFIFFKDRVALENFKRGNLEFGARPRPWRRPRALRPTPATTRVWPCSRTLPAA
jgi:lipid-binding SYLF domain-containing protein